MERRLPQFFFVLSLIVLALMLAAVWQAGTSSTGWKRWESPTRRQKAMC